MDNHSVVRIAFLDVGQGDTIVITIPETKEAVIVDCIDANAVLNYLEREEIRHIRGLLVTHLHLDHFGGVIQFLNNVEREINLSCESVFFHLPKLSKSLHDSILFDADRHSNSNLDVKLSTRKRETAFKELLSWGKAHKERYYNLTKQADIDNLPLKKIIDLIHPWEIDIPELLSKGLNNTSAVLKVSGTNSSALLTGDIEPSGWELINKAALKSDVLKFPHHGAWKDDDVNTLLSAVNPSLIVISVGTSGSQYNHPNKHVFKAIAHLPHIRLLCTQATTQCGNLSMQVEKDVKDLFKRQKENGGDFFIEQKGCPCAGTVIVELGTSVQVIQPKENFHKNEIIRSNYPTNQCLL